MRILCIVFTDSFIIAHLCELDGEYRQVVLLQIDFDILRRRMLFPSDIVRLYNNNNNNNNKINRRGVLGYRGAGLWLIYLYDSVFPVCHLISLICSYLLLVS